MYSLSLYFNLMRLNMAELILSSKVVDEVKGEPFYDRNMGAAKEAAEKYAKKHKGFVAPMHLLLRNFPHFDWHTANMEDISGFDKEGIFVSKNEPVVITYQGGFNGDGVLSSEKIKQALELYDQKKGGLNAVYAAVLADLYPNKEVIAELLRGNMPDGQKVDIFSYRQILAGENKQHNAEFRPYAIVRPLSLARETVSGYGSIDRLTDDKGKVKDSQVIVYAGGVEEAQNVIDNARRKFKSGKLGVWHPFNLDKFSPEQEQARVGYLGVSGDGSLIGDYGLSNNARFVGVAPEAPVAPKNLGAEAQGKPESKLVFIPSLEQVMAVSGRFTDDANKEQLRQELEKLYRQ